MAKAAEQGSIACPFCGELMETPLKFCVACGRAITSEDLKRAGLKLQSGKFKVDGRPGVARRDYTFHRKSRTLMYTISGVLTILISYYAVMKYVLHEHIPGNLDVKVEQLIIGIDGGNKAAVTPAVQPAGH
jgi:hypothetical protein